MSKKKEIRKIIAISDEAERALVELMDNNVDAFEEIAQKTVTGSKEAFVWAAYYADNVREYLQIPVGDRTRVEVHKLKVTELEQEDEERVKEATENAAAFLNVTVNRDSDGAVRFWGSLNADEQVDIVCALAKMAVNARRGKVGGEGNVAWLEFGGERNEEGN